MVDILLAWPGASDIMKSVDVAFKLNDSDSDSESFSLNLIQIKILSRRYCVKDAFTIFLRFSQLLGKIKSFSTQLNWYNKNKLNIAWIYIKGGLG